MQKNGPYNSIDKLDNSVTSSYHNRTAELNLKSVLLLTMKGWLCLYHSGTAGLSPPSPGNDPHSENNAQTILIQFPTITTLEVPSDPEECLSSMCKLKLEGFGLIDDSWS